MWTRPSTPSSSSTKAPKGTILTTLPVTTLPTAYFSAAVFQGSALRSLRDKEILPFSGLTSSTVTVTLSPTFNTSVTFLTLPQLISEMWIRPSTPPKSTKAPNSTIRLTVPSILSPTLIVSNTLALFSSISFWAKAFLPATILVLALDLSNSRISKS